jgi:hypothetical protein
VELSPPAGLALHPDPSPHERYELGGDGKPEPRPAETPGGGRIGLRERIEDGGLLRGRNADAGIAHREVQRHRGFF